MFSKKKLEQDELKKRVAKAVIQYILPGFVVGVGTGSTVNFFIEELAKILFDYCNKRLSYFKVPAWFSFRCELPKTGSQKIQKHMICGPNRSS